MIPVGDELTALPLVQAQGATVRRGRCHRVMSQKKRILATVLLGALAVSWPQPSSAQPTPPTSSESERVKQRQRAEALEVEGKYIACAEAYMGIYNADPRGDHTDEVLYNAGVCFADGKSTGLAIKAFSLLEKRHPSSRLIGRALIYRASLAASYADYGQAARVYELYAKRFGGEKDAPSMLQNAITYRRALGQDKEAIANIERFAKMYGRKLKEESAAALFSLASIHEKAGDVNATIAAHKNYIARVGKKGGRDRLIVAYAQAGALLWKASCAAPNAADGTCTRLQPVVRDLKKASPKALPTRCSAGPIVDIQVRTRDKGQAREAISYFEIAIKLAKLKQAEQGAFGFAPDIGRKEAKEAAASWLAASQFALLDAQFESFLKIKFPKGLDFSSKNAKRKKDSEKRFTDWIASTKRLATELNASYGELKDSSPSKGPYHVAATARAAQVSLRFAHLLQTAEIPKSVRSPPYGQDGINAYCSALTTAAEPLEDAATSALVFCLDLSSKHEQAGRWSRLCERELAELRPEDFPLRAEYHGGSRAVGDILDREALMKESPPTLAPQE